MRFMSLCAAALVAGSGAALAEEPLTLQLKWLPQAQFAGYYVAQHKGFYAREDLDVTILPGGPEVSPVLSLATGTADVALEWMATALASRENGISVVNVAQPFKRSGMSLVCRRDAGISKPDDLAGKTLGVWFNGNEYPFLSWMRTLGYSTDGGAEGVQVVRQGFDVDLLLSGEADCISAMSYNEYWAIVDSGFSAQDLVVFGYEDNGVATLEDGLYSDEMAVLNPEFQRRVARFVRASMRGWDYALAHRDEAVAIVMAQDSDTSLDPLHQLRMLDEIAKLLDGSDGVLSEADYERTVSVLLGGGSDPIITQEPFGAWTHEITDLAIN